MRNQPGLLTVLALVGLIGVVGAFFCWQRSADEADPSPVYAPRSPRLDDSGFGVVNPFVLPIKDPLSFEQIRTAYFGAARRGIAALQSELDRSTEPLTRVERLITIGQLHMYDGAFTEAEHAYAEARTLIDANPNKLRGRASALLFLQGVAALRRGETDNCVKCQCESSCIFPIQSSAVHQKREGSQRAMQFFTEYLQLHPDDLGAKWLLNVAAMTLGEYPSSVRSEYRLEYGVMQSDAIMNRFVDVAAKAGITRLHQAGGAILDDFDNDGLLDFMETAWDASGEMRFYRNRGDGTFEDRTAAAKLTSQLGGLQCVQADYNNDSYLDVFISRGAWMRQPMRPSLLRNNGDGSFTDVTAEAKLLTPGNGQVAAWADYDNDGWIDLFVGDERGRSRLHRSRGDGTFEEVAQKAGVANEGQMCKGAAWGDYDADGFPDLYVANLTGPPRLFHNNRNGTFTDVAAAAGIMRPSMGFSCWYWDYDNDGMPDIYANSYDPTLTDVIRNLLRQPHKTDSSRLYRNLGNGRFEDVSAAAGVDLVAAPMGTNFADFDGDGFLDFYLGTGDPKYSLLVPNRMFKNVEGKRFAEVTLASGTGHLQKGHGVACGDYDRDGDIDLFEQLGGATPGDAFRTVLFQNPGHGNAWISIKLIGKETNRAAIGARIKLTTEGSNPRSIHRWVTSGSSFGGNPLEQTIGLGKAERIARLEVHWPTSGTTQVFENLTAGQAIEITEFADRWLPRAIGR
jgi:hypothetical protein